MARNAPKPAIINVLPILGKRLLILFSNSQFGDQKGCGVCLARISAAGQILLHANLHSRHPWSSSRRQAPMDGFTAFLDRHTPHPKIGENAQTGNYYILLFVESKIQIGAMGDITYRAKASCKNASKLFQERLSAREL